jgi:hypothetical protein
MMMGNAATSGSWKNYCMAGGHMNIPNSFLNNFIKG